LAITEIVRELELPVSTGLLDELAAESAPHHAAYALQTFADGLPDELLPSYCAAQNRLAVDAPMGDFDLEEEKATPEIVTRHRGQGAQPDRVPAALPRQLPRADGQLGGQPLHGVDQRTAGVRVVELCAEFKRVLSPDG
jgi:hypothetical protein